MAKKILLTHRCWAIVDNNRYKDLNSFTWHLRKSGKNKYAARNVIINGKWKTLYMHWFVLPRHEDPNIQIDHINNNGLDNRRTNLQYLIRGNNVQKGWLKNHVI